MSHAASIEDAGCQTAITIQDYEAPTEEIYVDSGSFSSGEFDNVIAPPNGFGYGVSAGFENVEIDSP